MPSQASLAPTITFRVLNDDNSKAAIAQAIVELESLLGDLRRRFRNPADLEMLSSKLSVVERFKQDFQSLDKNVAEREQTRALPDSREEQLTEAVETVERRMLLTSSESGQNAEQRRLLSLIETLLRQIEVAQQQIQMPGRSCSDWVGSCR
ncbi:methyl-accepting chemotaxis protein [Pseudomonas sp. R5(2019)]|uniref:methyl-accepting chemotaxis protein n=1 Tax=Pseudomonas sp. R5(2019) TaxID=2697566 RepID=UPI001411FCDB|nr:methyl-accepting chemotaxis protein [Pseudomonas sp. R5(2019)]NBA94098.1 hypothetical protein [Pseudomonas sp. R5(2019)]